MREADGREALAYWRGGRGGRFASERLAQRLGVDPRSLPLRPQLPCGPELCRWTTSAGRPAALALTEAGAALTCGNVELLVSLAPLPASLRARCRWTLAVDGSDLARSGGLAVFETERGFTLRVVRDGGPRPWRREPPQA